ncbi:cobalamin biosynthesis protein CobD [Butyricimonas virosa]|uniref:Cobalamin biosynthesis protein CobD n=1 Tax=Butyricimonas virosa TaxID=544645 RepID=A0A412WY73_9BACT|nr:adenosylcobinamide-phosphate synthase CbiB [Butyricimonas virosa]MBR5463210.1 cobalamin biosynthesis protein CobD [Butyricimonas sp.]MBS5624727.1 cobalamin biosynthesis protein CobD [Porphyromonadaceae bacterium]MCI7388487.1 adenosylcobinamide-phosphate synthase CbiB [Butyricimonas virosa]MDY4905462.1 adenosylcobinamide-phosphate synthase CbiB [Butyricimonas virosa]MDY5490393.1 adenosylcobinamide-phosphate synthase CbiB [Butyricimonas virosa]
MLSFSIFTVPLIIGYLLDLIFGDPRKLPHPIVAFGNIIGWCERHFNKGGHKKRNGCLIAIILPLSTLFLGGLLAWGSWILHPFAYYGIASVFVFYGLANHSLIQEGGEVIRTLEEQGLDAGRKRLSWIVGRDTSQLSPKKIYTAVLETMAENLSDGVVAPLFFYALGGFPAMMAYKMVNTLDSMIGYKDARYKDFGCCSAHLDDVLNYIPARLTAFLIALSGYRKGIFSFIRKYARQHASPNSGYPESAMAGILDCRFGGPNIYHGMLVEKPYIGTHNRELSINDYKRAARINQTVCLSTVILICLVFTPLI